VPEIAGIITRSSADRRTWKRLEEWSLASPAAVFLVFFFASQRHGSSWQGQR
jgi:hypothetical protein